MTRYIKDLATDVMLMTAAIIGAVLMLTAVAAATHHTAASEQPTRTTATQVYPCDAYLSHGEMVINQEFGPAPTPAFCVGQ